MRLYRRCVRMRARHLLWVCAAGALVYLVVAGYQLRAALDAAPGTRLKGPREIIIHEGPRDRRHVTLAGLPIPEHSDDVVKVKVMGGGQVRPREHAAILPEPQDSPKKHPAAFGEGTRRQHPVLQQEAIRTGRIAQGAREEPLEKPRVAARPAETKTDKQTPQPKTPHVALKDNWINGRVVLRGSHGNGSAAEQGRYSPVREHEKERFPIYRAAMPTSGWPWPLPLRMTSSDHVIFRIQPNSFKFVASGETAEKCQLLLEAFERYEKSFPVPTGTHQASSRPEVKRADVTIGACSDWPSRDMKEDYELRVTSEGVTTSSSDVWGALRALETLVQLTYLAEGEVRINETAVTDRPRYPHRGLLIDTARHFLTPDVIKLNLEAMAQAKMNVLHWHVVDDQSFPYASSSFPQLSLKGAYHPDLVYGPADVTAIVEHARRRGIRVIPEFDTPGHTRSWGHGLPSLLSSCGHATRRGPLNPTANATYHVLRALLGELAEAFPDEDFHVGGDEVSPQCWHRDQAVMNFLGTRDSFPRRVPDLLPYHFQRLFEVLDERKKKIVIWEDSLEAKVEVPRGSTIQFWKEDGLVRPIDMLFSGYDVIYSACWYLNYVGYGPRWLKYYSCDPEREIVGRTGIKLTDKERVRVRGGEAAVWGEFVDDTNLITTAWPDALAVAERLWSPENKSRDPVAAEPRLEEMVCRMRRRGIGVKPGSGPSSCRYSPLHATVHKTSLVEKGLDDA